MKKMFSSTLLWSVILTAMVSAFPIPSFAGTYEEGVSSLAKGDFANAVKLFRKLAAQGDYSGQYQLGSMYLDGLGVPQDYVEAAKWFRESANQGNAIAQVSLGEMYEQGKGVPQDYAQAYMWFNLAAAQFPSVYSGKRDNLANSMTSKQIVEGQQLSRKWKQK